MKKIFIIILCLIMLVGLVGCNKVEKNPPTQDIISIASDTYKSGNGKFTHTRFYPTIKTENKKLIEIYDDVKKISDSWFEKNINDFIENEYDDGLTQIITVLYENDNIITFSVAQEGSAGGVSWTDEYYLNYDKTTAKLLKFNDIVMQEEYIDAIKKLLIKKIENSEYIDELNNDEVSKWQDNLDEASVGFCENGLIFTFPKYSISYGAMGVLSFELDKADVAPYLKEVYGGVATYND